MVREYNICKHLGLGYNFVELKIEDKEDALPGNLELDYVVVRAYVNLYF